VTPGDGSLRSWTTTARVRAHPSSPGNESALPPDRSLRPGIKRRPALDVSHPLRPCGAIAVVRDLVPMRARPGLVVGGRRPVISAPPAQAARVLEHGWPATLEPPSPEFLLARFSGIRTGGADCFRDVRGGRCFTPARFRSSSRAARIRSDRGGRRGGRAQGLLRRTHDTQDTDGTGARRIRDRAPWRRPRW
jgi:hypothetical protein